MRAPEWGEREGNRGAGGFSSQAGQSVVTVKTKKLAIASVVATVALLLFVGALLFTNYRSQTSLKATLVERFMIDNERLAGNLSSFLNSRRDDLANIASSRVMEALFESRAPGGRGDGGPAQKQSLTYITEKFRDLMERYRLGSDQPYDRIVLIGEDGAVLADTRPGPGPAAMAGLPDLREPRYRNGAIVATAGGEEILVSTACYFKGRYAGQIVAWLRTAFLFDYVLAQPPSSRSLTYLMAGKDVISGFAVRRWLPGQPIDATDTPVEFDGLWRGGEMQRLLAVKNLVLNSPFSVVSVAPTREVFGRLEPRGLLAGMAALAAVIIGSAISVVRLNTRSLVLTARLDESLRHEQEVTAKNRQLELEVAERKQAVEALRRGEERYRTLIETSPDMIYSISAEDGTIRSLNSAFEKITGWTRESWLGRPFADLVHPDDRALALRSIDEVLRGKPQSRYELRCLAASGDYRVAEFTSTALVHDGAVVGEFGIARDITERKKLEEQLRHVEKMQAVGQLAGGIAHDFNNMLSVIIGYCSILREDMKTGEPLRQYVDLIFASAERAAQLTRNLLAFSRKQVLKISAADVNAITVAVEPLLARLTGEAVVMEVSLADEPLWVMGDSVQIEQVLMNLVSNARDAMPQGGRLTIATSRIVMDDEFRRVHGFGKAGPYALVSVADTGVGMDDSTRERVFEPFFTTKDVGKGTGLGLSSAFGIVKQHQGYIEVESRLGKGTTFSIYLPLLDSVETAAAAPRTAVSVSKGSETILLAEDNDEVRSMLARVLEGAGYSVIPARDGLHAVSEFKASADRISLLIMDVMMPNKNGKEAYEEIKAIRPDVKVLFVTGYAADILRQSGLNDREAAFLSKPVMPTALLAKIRELLDHGEALGAG